MDSKPRLLLIERNHSDYSHLKGTLEQFFQVETAPDAVIGLSVAFGGHFDFIVTENSFNSGITGSQLISELKNAKLEPPKAILFDENAEPVPHKAEKFVRKPFNPDVILQIIRQMIPSMNASA